MRKSFQKATFGCNGKDIDAAVAILPEMVKLWNQELHWMPVEKTIDHGI
jgi:hypothetical protein